MATDVHKLIAAINPSLYCKSEVRDEVKKIAKEKGYLEASKKAELVDPEPMDFEDIYYKTIMKSPGLKAPLEQNKVLYDTSTAGLESLYFWMLDVLQEEYGPKIDKIVDTFIGSAGSGFYSEMGGKATRMQEEAMKMLGAANQVIKSILNILYDLKEFELRLEPYDRFKSGKKEEKESALLTLKQVWMDTVDIKRGTTSLKGFSQQFEYVTLIDAFMAATTPSDIDKLDLNDRVKRIVKQRAEEFFKWIEISEKELKKRFEIEKIYLKSQVNTVHLYARWVKPYLDAARKLEQNATETPSLVTAFNTTLFELTLFTEGKYNPDDDVAKGDFPKFFKDIKKRKYSPVGIVEFKFRTIPERNQQGGYGYRGRAEVTFTGYALNEDEIKVFKEELAKDDLNSVMGLIKGTTEESLGQLKEDLDKYLTEKKDDKKEAKKEEKNPNDTNPFTELYNSIKSLFKFEEKKPQKTDLSKGIPPDTDIEKHVRSQAIILSRKINRKVYDSFKKSNNMPTFAPPFPI